MKDRAGSPPRKSQGTFIEEARRKQVLDIALDIIADQGYRQTTIDMIAQQAGVSKGVIYYHFGGKTELTAAIWTALMDELWTYRKSRVDQQVSASDKLRAYIEACFEFLFSYRKRHLAAIFEAGVDLTAKEGRNPWSSALNARAFGFITQILKEGQARGEFGHFSPEKLAPVIQSAIDGLVVTAYSDPAGVDWPEGQQTIIEVIFSYLRRPGGRNEG
ncbi:MAG: TetR/AcrR family transcriptional regulator [Thermodesulfobacteriota bacterium]